MGTREDLFVVGGLDLFSLFSFLRAPPEKPWISGPFQRITIRWFMVFLKNIDIWKLQFILSVWSYTNITLNFDQIRDNTKSGSGWRWKIFPLFLSSFIPLRILTINYSFNNLLYIITEATFHDFFRVLSNGWERWRHKWWLGRKVKCRLDKRKKRTLSRGKLIMMLE